MLNTDQTRYKEEGYVLIRDFFSPEELDRILLSVFQVFSLGFEVEKRKAFHSLETIHEVEALLFDLFSKDSGKFINLGKQVQHLIELWRLASSQKIENLLHALELDFPNFSVRPSIFFNSRKLDNRGHYWKLGSHQDWRSSQGSIDSVTIWYPYVDCNVDLGALEVIPKSHLEGLFPCSEVDYYSKIDDGVLNEDKYVPVEMNKGDLLIFNSFLVHRSGTNSTNSVRWSSQLRYNNLNESSFIERRLPNPYIYKPFSELVEPGPPSKEAIIAHFTKDKG